MEDDDTSPSAGSRHVAILAKPHADSIFKNVLALFVRAEEEQFEDGMESRFAESLLRALAKNGLPVIEAVKNFVLSSTTSPVVSGEALRWLARADDAATAAPRRALLETALSHPEPMIRDAAALGIASMDDTLSIPFVEAAMRAELIPELRADLEQVLRQLQTTGQCR